jgi:glutathione synthase/RimK-type ligase-like ATP-grasp enzyme
MAILFLSELAQDAHLLPVAAELARRGYRVRTFNSGDFPGEATITTDWADSAPVSAIRWAEDELDLASVTSVWLRRPGRPRLSEHLLPTERDWLRLECSDFLGALWANLDALWVSAPDRLRQANLKLLQLRLAGELGFRVPRFTCTNDPARARAFIAAHPGGVITKVLTNPTLQVDDRAAMIYTHLLTEDDWAHLDSVRHGPTFLQEFVPKRRDVRVTVIGDELFAVGIDPAGDHAAAIDFRRADAFDLPHEPLTLPPPVHAGCLALVRRLGLQFGAIDLLLTGEGEYVFLEINPNGQWLWIELVTELPLTRAMADLLSRREESARPRHFAPVGAIAGKHRLPVGTQTLPVSAGLGRQLRERAQDVALAGTRAWVERKRDRLRLHVGDVARDGLDERCEVGEGGGADGRSNGGGASGAGRADHRAAGGGDRRVATPAGG